MRVYQRKYQEVVQPKLKNDLALSSIMEAPRFEKVVINMGVGKAAEDKRKLEEAVEEMTLIAGQKPVVTRARKSIAGFKIREGWPIGCKVTLRRDRMYDFLQRLIDIYIPRIRDFRGFSRKSFDGQGNYTLGIKEQIVCPEIDFDKISSLRGFDITIVTTAKSDAEALALLQAFSFPFKDRG